MIRNEESKLNKIEIKPTTENVIEMLDKNAIGRNQYISAFLEMLDNIDDNFTIFIIFNVFFFPNNLRIRPDINKIAPPFQFIPVASV